MDKDFLIEVFNDTERWIDEEPVLTEAVLKSIEGTKVYLSAEYPAQNTGEHGLDTTVSVSPYSSFEASMALRRKFRDSKIAVHNFASATDPGGGVREGSRAQEESLCRCSTLYPVLNTEALQQSYYGYHRQFRDMRYTDRCIYSPGILIIKTDTDMPERMDMKEWCQVDVITCAAPNLSGKVYGSGRRAGFEPIAVDDDELKRLHKRRAEHMLNVAAANKAEILVLGAFGCGAFCNDPQSVAEAYKEVLPHFYGSFRHIEFAVRCSPMKKSKNYSVFKNALGQI